MDFSNLTTETHEIAVIVHKNTVKIMQDKNIELKLLLTSFIITFILCGIISVYYTGTLKAEVIRNVTGKKLTWYNAMLYQYKD